MGLVWLEWIDDLSAETSFLSPAAKLSMHSCLSLYSTAAQKSTEQLEDKIPGDTESIDSSSLQTWVANSELILLLAVFFLFPFLCLCVIGVYVYMLVYMWAHVLMYMHVCVEVQGCGQETSSITRLPYLLRQGLSVTFRAQGYACSHLLSLNGWWAANPTRFTVSSGDLNYGPHVCKTST